VCRLVSFVKPVITGKETRKRKVSECGTPPRLEGKDGLIYLGLEREFLFIVEDLDPL